MSEEAVILIKLCPYCNGVIINNICDNCGYNKTDYELFEKEKSEEEKFCENCGQKIKGKNCLYCRINIKEKSISQKLREKQLKEKRKKKRIYGSPDTKKLLSQNIVIGTFLIFALGFALFYLYLYGGLNYWWESGV